MAGPAEALVLLFALEELRRACAEGRTPGLDPRHDLGPFRTFRERLLTAAAGCARAEARLSMWWEGTFNGYALAVEVLPGEALPGLAAAAAAACPLEAVRRAEPRAGALPLASVGPGQSALLRCDDGTRAELPFGAPTGHFGAPGVVRLPADEGG